MSNADLPTEAYFLTVDWCDKGPRGIFCSRDGKPFREDGKPHTEQEMHKILDLFWLVLSPKSEKFTYAELSEFTYWRPLAEFSNQYGIAHRADEVPIRVLEEENHD